MWQIKRLFEILNDDGILEAAQIVLVYFSVWNAIKFRDFRLMFSCDLGQDLPKSTSLDHPVGIVVHADAEVGKNVHISQNVTIGKGGKGKDGLPTIHDDAIIYSGAVVLGDITIGEGAVVGANAVVLDDVPEGQTAVGSPATLLSQ